MAISRVAGPMLLSSLDRQGTDLSFVTDPGTGTRTLLQMDFTNFRLGVNTAVLTSSEFTVEGNISVNSAIVTSSTNRHMYLKPNGTGQVIISNASILTGNIEATTIGLSTPAYGKFTTANTTGKATFASAQVTSLTPSRVVFSNGVGLTDDPGLLYFTGNSTLRATNLESAGSIGYSTVAITTGLFLNYASQNQIPYFAANSMFITSPSLNYFAGNGVIRTPSLQLSGQQAGRILYTDSSNAAVGTSYLTFNGQNLTATGITTLGQIQVYNNIITGTVADGDIQIIPLGAGSVDVQNRRIINLATPLTAADAATKAYVDGLVSLGSTYSIGINDSKVQVNDTGAVATVTVTLNNNLVATFSDTQGVTLGNYNFYNNIMSTTAGDLVMIPANNNKVVMNTSSALTLPIGTFADRPGIPTIGDLRYNSDLGTIEWYTGPSQGWNDGASSNTVASQIITTPDVDGTAYIFTLNQSADSSSVIININGVVQRPTVDYTVVGTTLTMQEVPVVTDVIEVRFLAASTVYAADPLYIGSQYIAVSNTGTVIDSFYVTQHRSAIYDYSVKNVADASNQFYQLGQIFLVQNSITANTQVSTKSSLGTPATDLVNWSTSISGLGLLTLTATATGMCVANTSSIVSLTFTSRGSGYSSGTVGVTFSAPQVSGGKTATGTVTLFTGNGAVNYVTLTNAGSGYTTKPTVTFTGTNSGSASATITGTGLAPVTVVKISRKYFSDV